MLAVFLPGGLGFFNTFFFPFNRLKPEYEDFVSTTVMFLVQRRIAI